VFGLHGLQYKCEPKKIAIWPLVL
jgi:hypothetical protein